MLLRCGSWRHFGICGGLLSPVRREICRVLAVTDVYKVGEQLGVMLGSWGQQGRTEVCYPCRYERAVYQTFASELAVLLVGFPACQNKVERKLFALQGI